MVYFFENKVNEVSQEIRHTENKLLRYDEDLRVLEAEWSYLNNPKRIRELMEKTQVTKNSKNLNSLVNSLMDSSSNSLESPKAIQFTNLKSLPDRELKFSNVDIDLKNN